MWITYLLPIIVLISRVDSHIRGYERILGPSAIMRQCGEDGQPCLNDINCCPEYECSEHAVCELRKEVQAPRGGSRSACTNDSDCPTGMCCSGSLYERVCSYYCPRPEDHEVVPAGVYYGRGFWNLWARKRRMDVDRLVD
ncbi:unnamed protein product [Calicophoron daubneyi]|uniref:Uncharacterized protein n=1 Tax=Calicophoron daubneyi TaxID=300641 RepID=A0AAV2SYS5_CALDB